VHCTIEDWAKFVALHLEGENGNASLLKADTWRRLHQPINGLQPQYAFGWIITERDWAGGRTLTHNGTNTLWFSVVWMAPKKDFAVLVACNQGGKAAEKTVDDAAWALIQDHLKFSESR
jgi:CubicO group peptidase (beta-lactamase class C family)